MTFDERINVVERTKSVSESEMSETGEFNRLIILEEPADVAHCPMVESAGTFVDAEPGESVVRSSRDRVPQERRERSMGYFFGPFDVDHKSRRLPQFREIGEVIFHRPTEDQGLDCGRDTIVMEVLGVDRNSGQVQLREMSEHR